MLAKDMLVDTTKLIEHEIGDIIDIQIYHPDKDSIEIVEENGRITGFGISNNFHLKASPVMFQIRIETLDENKKFESGSMIACGTVTGVVRDYGLLEVDMTQLPEHAIQKIGGKYIGLTTVPSANGVSKYEAYVIPFQDAGRLGVKVGCLGRCERK